jgi:phasin family protein
VRGRKQQTNISHDQVNGNDWMRQERPQPTVVLLKELGKVSKCITNRRKQMGSPRQEDKSMQGMEDAARRAGEKAAEQTTRIGQAATDGTSRVGQAAAEAGEQMARASADLLKQNLETLQEAWRVGLETATSAMGRSTEQLGRTLGVSGDGEQQAREATQRSARNVQTVLHSGTAAAKVMGGMSREYFEMVRQQLEKNMARMSELWGCRTPQDFAAVQSDMMRETVETALESSRRVADMSLKMVEDTGKADQTRNGGLPAQRLAEAAMARRAAAPSRSLV